VAVWQIGIEFERAWMRSYHGPLIGERPTGGFDELPEGSPVEARLPPVNERRRWVRGHHPRLATRPMYMAWARRA
jgi:hypothetical protein